VIELTTERLHWLLNGIDIDAVRRHPMRPYRDASLMPISVICCPSNFEPHNSLGQPASG
jgi:hypothetical protein